MGDLKTILGSLTLALLSSLPAHAMPDAPRDQAQFFATCLGRFSATREHAWLMGGEDHQAEAGYSLFQDLLSAVIDDARQSGLSGKTVLANRIEAKMAHARLLQAATFQQDERRRHMSQRLADQHLMTCQIMVLS
ncbi:hypothetical protein TRP8649_01946 [Pelagimonas phthalicica]|uniref:Uncharacterized protein n=1 Tax=Pelagimonas phthalicica TaxID=1037362 RepID=A0A238JDC1_9RHOB|nr:hypothetical protein [Pelagimonas phthalicica]TDS93641.1 hypothetical protein CLV87_0126 [Pelagimonas phthalicica]SMX27836.1 hypothetical protein TRP8649_01946 [Pelagimonas phthalicica]